MKIIPIIASPVYSGPRTCVELAKRGEQAITMDKYSRGAPAALWLTLGRWPCGVAKGRIGRRKPGGRS